MKFTSDFESFLRDEVNLNKSRLDTLTSRVNTIEEFLEEDETFGNILIDVIPAGSWAYRTIIKPATDARTFDADVLIHVKDQTDWQPDDYIGKLYSSFRASSTYKDLVHRKTRCLRINYAGDFHLDLVPYMERGGLHYITNRLYPEPDGGLERSNPEAFAEWLDDRQRYTEGTFVKVVRLLKYLRDVKGTFSCKSIMLTTLLGNEVNAIEASFQPEKYSDVPTTLTTLLTKLADSLPETMPAIMDPGGSGDNFCDRYGDDWNYINFRDQIRRYADKVSDAYDETDRDTSISAWQEVFGASFKPGSLQKVAAIAPTSAAVAWRDEQFIDRGSYGFPIVINGNYDFKVIGRCTGGLTGGRVRRNGFRQFDLPTSGNQVAKDRRLRFRITRITVPAPYDIYWKVRNGGEEALRANALRGEIKRDEGQHELTESTSYRGTHYVECYVVKGGEVVARDRQTVIVR